MSRRFIRLLGICLLGGSLVTGCQIDGDQAEEIGQSMAPVIVPDGVELVPDHYIVMFENDVPRNTISMAADRVRQERDGSQVTYVYGVIPAFAAKLNARALDALRRDSRVAYIEQDIVMHANTVHSTNADGIDRVDQRTLPRDGQFDDYGNSGAGVHAYVIDTGIRTTHSEFTGRVGAGRDLVDNDADPSDCHGHGTHVASTVAGTQYGLAKGATVHGVRVLNCQGSGSNSGVIAGVDWVTSNHIKPAVANMSLGGSATSTLDQAVANSVAAGVTFAVAAGNDNANACNYSPAREASAITVAAADDSDGRASFSNFGTCVDIFAPGVSILGAWYNSDTATNTISGTSMASPHVAGAAALYLQSNPGATPAQVAAALNDNGSINCISSVSGTPNVLLHNNYTAGQYDCGGGGGGGDPDPNSCYASNACGGTAPGGCYCDLWCVFFGDCCSDGPC
jgi:subtilisin family serine protease